jgi:hypothetical protein
MKKKEKKVVCVKRSLKKVYIKKRQVKTHTNAHTNTTIHRCCAFLRFDCEKDSNKELLRSTDTASLNRQDTGE